MSKKRGFFYSLTHTNSGERMPLWFLLGLLFSVVFLLFMTVLRFIHYGL